VPSADSCSAAKRSLIDHLIGNREERWRNFDAERFRSLEVDDQLELGRFLDGKVASLFPTKDAINIRCCSTKNINFIGSV
jgi:hypothetical protein